MDEISDVSHIDVVLSETI